MFKLIRVFLIISLYFISLSSCKHYRVEGTKITTEKETYTVPFFNTAQKEYFYNADIKVFGNTFSGILVVKKLENNSKRLALLSEFGNTLLDFEFVNGKVNVIYIMEDLNKRIVVKKLKKYFQLLVNSEYKIRKTFDTEGGKTYISKLQGKRIFLNLDDTNQLTDLKQASVFRNKVGIQFYGDLEYADSIEFNSFELPVTIGLKKRN